MDVLNSFILGVWLPALYIAHGIIFKKININKFTVFILTLSLLVFNWRNIGRIQNVHVIGLSVLAVFLFPPNVQTKKLMIMIGILSTFILLTKKLSDNTETMRQTLIFGPNTDAAILIIILTPLVYKTDKINILLYLLLAAVVIFSTQSRSAILLIAPIALLIFPFSEKYLLKHDIKFHRISILIIAYTSSMLAIFLTYKNLETLYSLSGLDLEARWSFASCSSDLDRLAAFMSAQEVAFKNWPSILFGADILPLITGASNVVHSEIFSVLFGGGVVLFFPVSILMMKSVFNIKSRFAVIYTVFYLITSGFSTSLLSFPFLFMVSSLFRNIKLSIPK